MQGRRRYQTLSLATGKMETNNDINRLPPSEALCRNSARTMISVALCASFERQIAQVAADPGSDGALNCGN